MKFIKSTILTLGALATLSTSCRKEGCTDDSAINYSEEAKKDDASCIYDNSVAVPSTYSFNRDGVSSVSFDGQKERLDMLSELVAYMKTANTAGVAVSADDLKAMYANDNFTWADVNNLGMTGSSKQLKNKTAYAVAGGSADTGVQDRFLAYFDSIANISATTTTAVENGMANVSGVWPNDGSKGPYLMGGNGKEYTQFVEKGLMCAVFMNQITVNYLGGINNSDNTTIVDATAGKNYTEMEHHWDEAFGYFTSEINFPTAGTDRFWGKYSFGREDLIGSATKIYNAFKTGRTAIVNKDYTSRDANVVIINDELERVAAGTAIHYLNSAKDYITNNTARNHVLSEATAFLEGLKYGYNAISNKGMSSTEIDMALGYIGDDFNVVSISNLNAAIDLIAVSTGLESVKASL
ncbi:hypothetical protein DNU06_11935 [Putridiphycobacter roseus]|uniref:DUF4856 domain-containing protein n=1 Tax=Putridiphycobacter roseus TaxID=2219161 RepID=A0A2W1MXK6_9FLAO|nr:DUF4856 domain-containing protein [Putridiphycobacter roseus]PZE16557.1 hypothetical protein DNU06_11935 [Putridiphycobacter roseus]